MTRFSCCRYADTIRLRYADVASMLACAFDVYEAPYICARRYLRYVTAAIYATI